MGTTPSVTNYDPGNGSASIYIIIDTSSVLLSTYIHRRHAVSESSGVSDAEVSRVACRASSMMKPARSPLKDNTTETKNRGGEARGAPKYYTTDLGLTRRSVISRRKSNPE